jgi:hypothetical protein
MIENSSLQEYQTTIDRLRAIDVRRKYIMPGKNDVTPDAALYQVGDYADKLEEPKRFWKLECSFAGTSTIQRWNWCCRTERRNVHWPKAPYMSTLTRRAGRISGPHDESMQGKEFHIEEDPDIVMTLALYTEYWNFVVRDQVAKGGLCVTRCLQGRHTLFLSASVMGSNGRLSQPAWLVEIELPEATPEARLKSEADARPTVFPRLPYGEVFPMSLSPYITPSRK